MKKEVSKPRFATKNDTVIAAVIGESYRFDAKIDALALLEKIAINYIQAKEREQPRDDGSQVLKFWVAGFELTADEKAKGARGNFARVWMEYLPTGFYTLKCEKLDIPLNRHPQKDRAKGHHPNWGNPLMRAVDSGKVFSGIAEAEALLHQLHLEYPKATIPGKLSLHIMLYSRDKIATGGGGVARLKKSL